MERNLTLTVAEARMLQQILRTSGATEPQEVIAGGDLEGLLADQLVATPAPAGPPRPEGAPDQPPRDQARVDWEKTELTILLTDGQVAAARSALRQALARRMVPCTRTAAGMLRAVGLES